jgi:hypothetical protein
LPLNYVCLLRQLCFTDFVDPVLERPRDPARHFSTRLKVPIKTGWPTGKTRLCVPAILQPVKLPSGTGCAALNLPLLRSGICT